MAKNLFVAEITFNGIFEEQVTWTSTVANLMTI